ncbi:MAG: enoyl-CoA hydratase/isomerase family protein, partial [Mycobacterium sp.]
MTTESDEILTRVDHGVGLITLNRPKAINSLTHAMVKAMSPVLADWDRNDDIHAVVV